jgi:hypothetical protein
MYVAETMRGMQMINLHLATFSAYRSLVVT